LKRPSFRYAVEFLRRAVFSTIEVAHEFGRARLFYDAEQYEYRNVLCKQNEPSSQWRLPPLNGDNFDSRQL